MQHTQRRKVRAVGRGAMVLGVLLAVTGLATSPALADKPEEGQKTAICHATTSVTNPYRLIEVDLSATNGPDHNTHTGLVFDPEIHDPEFNESGKKVAWGDIIPGGLNWDEAGIAFYENECQLPDEPPDPPVCEFDPDLDADDPNCVEPTDVCPDLAGVQTDPADCPAPVDACPDLAGVQATTAECPVQVGGVVITAPAPTPAAPAAVAAAELPRTGSGTSQMTLVGLGLVLMGAGALVFGREHAIV